MRKLTFSILALSLFLAAPIMASAEDYTLLIKDGRFSPDQLNIPSGKKVKITIKNMDDNSTEFESYSLNREKIIPAHGEATLSVGPLSPGSYNFFDDFRRDVAKGSIIVK